MVATEQSFDELIGEGSIDAVGTYTGGFALGATGLIPGDSNKAVTLDGSTGYIAFGAVAEFDGVNSMECLVKVAAFPADGTYSVLIAKGYDGTQEGYQLSLYNNGGRYACKPTASTGRRSTPRCGTLQGG